MAKKRLAAYAVKVRKCHNEKAKEGWKAEDILGYFYKNIAFISE
jgi:hypothetical protein